MAFHGDVSEDPSFRTAPAGAGIGRREALRLLLAAASSAAAWPLASAAAEGGRQPVYPGRQWQMRDPADLGLDPAPLDRLAGFLGGRGCVVKDGWVVKAWGDQAKPGDLLSSAKPVLSTLLFFAIAEGRVGSVRTRVGDFGWDFLPKDRTMEFQHLGDMTSGYARPEPPGAAFSYNDYAIQLYQKTLFDRVFREVPERVANAPARLGALGLEDGLRFKPSNRRIYASARDFARIAWFWLQRGSWNGEPVLARNFFERYQRPQVPAGLPHTAKAPTNDYLGIGTYGGESDHFTQFGPGLYGFNWWYNGRFRPGSSALNWPDAPADAFMSIGARGNCSVMLPSLNMVLVSLAGNWGKTMIDPGNAATPANHAIALAAGAA